MDDDQYSAALADLLDRLGMAFWGLALLGGFILAVAWLTWIAVLGPAPWLAARGLAGLVAFVAALVALGHLAFSAADEVQHRGAGDE